MVGNKPVLTSYPMSKIISENKIPGERVGESLVKVEHFY